MSAVQRLTKWVEKEMKNGLQSIHLSVSPSFNGEHNPEALAQEILDAINSEEVEFVGSL